ncbi:aromatic ring-hydroxylating dioxygenase subunit alpha [Pseudoflavitalea sp. G-6-1-2]|uniref:aromatic ring-hydroxylating oxygenase subunit alpha n=1 Tax=Pseudoflavitalea sp. G-6-1-2 TaxID=2728841 RepID=UPI00146C0A9A|nr:aromatic ring-hydroxylating dioxygenase subunit alpha [Pseudoflavitalea sp. G-6-1-2]NML23437.1 aromatic ring-hydroxylating dioxygenase subunit alpha [Pseudoflavitalea sp. G-6-1-2]
MQRFYVDPDISVAKTLHTDFYTDTAMYQLAKEKIFAPSFQFIGDQQQVPEAGSCYPFTYLDGYFNEPLLLTRSNNGALHCLSNVCTHRGTIVVHEACKAAQLRCRYHGRLFHLDGKFKSMPEFKEVKDFPAESDNLTQLPVFKWGPLLFASLQRNSDPAPYLQDMIDRVGWLPIDDFVLKPELSKDYIVQSHWALYCENYLEGFHIPFVHAGLNAVIDFGNYTTELFRYSNLQLGIAKDDDDTFDLPASSPDYGKKVAAYYFFVFPNMMFNFYPWGLSINIVQPLAIDQCKVSFVTYVWNPDKFNTGAGSDLNTVEMEDEEVVEAVQLGVKSRFYEHGRYSVTREQGTHHFHRIISSILNP